MTYSKLENDPYYEELTTDEILKICRNFPGLLKNKYILHRLDEIYKCHEYNKAMSVLSDS